MAEEIVVISVACIPSWSRCHSASGASNLVATAGNAQGSIELERDRQERPVITFSVRPPMGDRTRR